jgi:hypothetical protein
MIQLTMMDGTAKVCTWNYINMYGKFKNQYCQWRLVKCKRFYFWNKFQHNNTTKLLLVAQLSQCTEQDKELVNHNHSTQCYIYTIVNTK